GTDELAGDDRGELVVAPAPRPADKTARRAAPGDDRAGRPPPAAFTVMSPHAHRIGARTRPTLAEETSDERTPSSVRAARSLLLERRRPLDPGARRPPRHERLRRPLRD